MGREGQTSSVATLLLSWTPAMMTVLYRLVDHITRLCWNNSYFTQIKYQACPDIQGSESKGKVDFWTTLWFYSNSLQWSEWPALPSGKRGTRDTLWPLSHQGRANGLSRRIVINASFTRTYQTRWRWLKDSLHPLAKDCGLSWREAEHFHCRNVKLFINCPDHWYYLF